MRYNLETITQELSKLLEYLNEHSTRYENFRMIAEDDQYENCLRWDIYAEAKECDHCNHKTTRYAGVEYYMHGPHHAGVFKGDCQGCFEFGGFSDVQYRLLEKFA